MRSGFKIGRLFGIDLTVDTSWVFIFALVTWNLTSLFGRWHQAWGPGTSLVVAVIAALLFFASVVAHELAHSLVARAHGLRVRNITLFMFGGVSNIEREPPSARAEFLTAVVGPLASFAIGALCLLLAGVGLNNVGATVSRPGETLAGVGPIVTLLLWLGPVNIGLGLFNLVPGFPLDGGRVLRSALWAATGDLRRATLWASRVGQGVAWAFIVAGAAMALGFRVPLLGTGLLGGLWLAFIGWFLNGAAAQTYGQVVMKDALAGLTVARLMRTTGTAVSPDVPLGRFLREWVMASDQPAFPVLVGDRFVGLVRASDAAGPTAQLSRGAATVADVMRRADELPRLAPSEDVAGAVDKLVQAQTPELPVFEGERFVGMLRAHDVARWVELQKPRELRPSHAG